MDPLLQSLLAAVEASPADVPLRLHVASLLIDGGDPARALPHVAAVLTAEPGNADAVALLARATAAVNGSAGPAGTAGTAGTAGPAGTGPTVVGTPPAAEAAAVPTAATGEPAPVEGFDWGAAEQQLGDLIEPAFVGGDEVDSGGFEVEAPRALLADVGGMENVKQRIEAAFLLPMRNPELRKAFGKSLRGGLLLYGPPGCGKTFLARALAGELGARLLSIGLNDVLDMYIGNSEKNLHEIFEIARRAAPCVLFFDEIDALGQKRSQTRGSALRGAVNQLLTEMDDVHSSNDGVFVLAATNHPWDVDPALRRPGRLDRTVFVSPPDVAARAAILKVHLRDRPVAGIDLGKLAARTEDFSGADLAHVCETATERALIDSARTGEVRPIGMADLEAALAEVRPSTGAWFQVARNVAEFGNDGGEYDELAAYLRTRKRR